MLLFWWPICAVLAAPGTVALTHVQVIQVADGSVWNDQTVLTRDGKIEAVGPAGSVPLPEDIQEVDARGKFLIPGLWDMHVHFASADYAALFVANGVVGVRDMHAHLPFMLLPLRQQIDQGRKLGPQIKTAISMVDGAPPLWSGTLSATTPDEGRQAVQTLRQKGANLIKIYSGLSPEVFDAILEEAKKTGLPVSGHVPESVGVVEASAKGLDSMEHIFGILTAASSEEEALRKEMVSSMRGVDAKTFYGMLIRSQVKALDTFDASRAQGLFDVFSKNRTYQCPTLTVHRMFARLTEPAFTADPRVRYTPALIKSVAWKQTLAWVEPIAQNRDDQRRLFAKTMEIVGQMYRAGVPILAGTDTSNPYVMAGFSLHDELELLVEAGLSPAAALRCATLEPARFWKQEGSQGEVRVGQRADLVVLDANPLEDIRQTRSIRGVMLKGTWLDRDTLDAMLAKAEATAAGGKK
jgi:imidazolonepropionase-like amidohydrolase